MNMKVFLVIAIAIALASVKIFYKQDGRDDGSGRISGEGSESGESNSSKDILESLKGTWIARRDKKNLYISVQGSSLTLKSDTLEKTIKVRDVDSNGLIFDDPDYVGIEFHHSLDAMYVIYDLPGTTVTKTDYYDRGDDG